jgi:epoxide hydrolase 4
MNDITFAMAPGDGLRLHYAAAGAGTPVVLLHGFPDFWYGWRHQLTVLADAGYRVLAPDLRGYNRSDRPAGTAPYRLDRLVADVHAFIRHAAPGGAHLVGHDWGGVIAWQAAAAAPELCRSLCILNAPHPGAYRRELTRNPRQMLRSWYVLFNQLPLLPEAAFRASDFALLRRVLGTAEDGSPMADEAELRRYVTAFCEPGALTAALNYYRAAARDMLTGRTPPTPPVQSPVLVIWGEQDPFLDRRLLDGLEDRVRQLTLERVGNAGHFVHWQRPDLVNRLLLEWLGRAEAPPGRAHSGGAG